MAVENAQGIQVSVEKGLSTATVGGVKVEVSPDSNVVVYTNDRVQTKPAAGAGEAAPHEGALFKGVVPPAHDDAHLKDICLAKRDGRDGGTHIHISEDFNTIVLNGATIERTANGHLVISTPGIVITKPSPANDGTLVPPAETAYRLLRAKASLQIGDQMPDGSIYAGTSPDTNKPMYVTPADAPLTYTFNQAQKYAAKLEAHSHHDWRVPTKREINVLFNNSAAIGGFDISGSDPAGWYWSSSHYYYGLAWAQRLSDGYQDISYKLFASSLRCVR